MFHLPKLLVALTVSDDSARDRHKGCLAVFSGTCRS